MNVKKKSNKLIRRGKNKNQRKTKKQHKTKTQRKTKKTRKYKKRRGGFRPSPVTRPRSIFSQEFIDHNNNMFHDDPRSFIITMVTHIRNRYVMDNIYNNGDFQDFKNYLYEKINELFQRGNQDDIAFYMNERGTFFDVDEDGFETLNMENTLLEDLSDGNNHDYFMAMVNLYRELPRYLTAEEILGTDE